MRAGRVAAAALALLLLAPAADAGLRVTSVRVDADPVDPGTGSAQATIVGEVDCTSLLLRRSPASTASVVLKVSWASPTMVIGGQPEHHVDPADCDRATLAVPFNLTLSAALPRSVPAMVEQRADVHLAFAPHEVDGEDPANASTSFTLRAKPVVVAQMTFAERTADMGKEPVTFLVGVRNVGNVAFAVAGSGSLARILGDPALTAQVDVSTAEVALGSEAELAVTVQPPVGGRWESAHVSGNLTFTSLLEPRGPPQEHGFDFVLVGPDAPKSQQAPAPAGLVAVALAALAVALRRR